MPPILSVIPPSNGGAFLLVCTLVVGSVGVDLSFGAGDYSEMLVWSIMNVVILLV